MVSTKFRRLLVGVGFALALVAIVTVSLIWLSRSLPIEHVTIVYLIPVLVAALRWGAGLALMLVLIPLAFDRPCGD